MEMLYHYTSVETLYKILHNVENGYVKLRANYYRNMNDIVECQYFAKMVNKILSKNEGSINIDNKTMRDNILEVGIPYIISFTELKDSLPMWNMYGGKGQGVAIGFSKDELCEATNHFQDVGDSQDIILRKYSFCKLYKCKYWNEDEIENKYIKKHIFKKDIHENNNAQTKEEICSISYLIKHPSFSYEEESRIVFLLKCPVDALPDQIELFVPPKAINQIICGPCIDVGFVKAVIPQSFHNIVIPSEIPYTDSTKKLIPKYEFSL